MSALIASLTPRIQALLTPKHCAWLNATSGLALAITIMSDARPSRFQIVGSCPSFPVVLR